MISSSLQHSAKQSLDRAFTQAVNALSRPSLFSEFKKPSLLFNQRGKIAGSALLQKNIIKLNAKLFEENERYFLEQVIPHELAHILVYQQYGSSFRGKRIKPHGLEWRAIMGEVFSLPADTTHQLDVSSVAMKTITYRCACRDFDLTLIRHNKVLKGKQKYYCRSCMQSLQATDL